jgi:hypothetical protein
LEKTVNKIRPATRAALLVTLIVVIPLGLSACNKTPTPSVAAAPSAAVAASDVRFVSANLSGANEVPAVVSSATGTVDARLNMQTAVLSWTVSFAGMSGDVTGAHFHGPASAGESAGVVVPVTGSTASPIKGEATLTAAQMADLNGGKWYFNLHTAANPNGEIRGQVIVKS